MMTEGRRLFDAIPWLEKKRYFVVSAILVSALLFGVTEVIRFIAPSLASEDHNASNDEIQIAQSNSGNCNNNIGGDNNAPINNDCPTINVGPPRQQNGFYQNGERIGFVAAFSATNDGKKISFKTLRISGNGMNLTAPIEFQNFTILCPTLYNISTEAVNNSILITGEIVCDIIGVRH